MLAFPWALNWPSLKVTSVGGFPARERCPQHSSVLSLPQCHTLPPHPLSASRNVTLCTLPYSRNPTAFHNHTPFTGAFISPLARLQAILSTFWLPAAVPASVLCPPPSHTYSSRKGPTLRSRVNHLLECIDHCPGSQFLPL